MEHRPEEPETETRATAKLSHVSEDEFARLLDFYGIRWEYEPRTFALAWDDDGSVTEAFTPDFYLPDLDLYIELTTMRQTLVTRKNRKLRRLRELYPQVNARILYRRNLKSLMVKYGLHKGGMPWEMTSPRS